MKGIEVELYEQIGTDGLGKPLYADEPETVANVLVGAPDTGQVVGDVQLYGRRLAYTLAIPKGDTHRWENALVEFWGQRFRAYGGVTEGMEALLPLSWNKQVRVERYE